MTPAYNYNSVISCDIETSALKTSRAELFSVSMISDNDTAFRNAIDVKNLPFIDLVIIKDSYDYFEPGAMKMNIDVIQEIAKVSWAVKSGKAPKNYYNEDMIESVLSSTIAAPLTWKEQLEHFGALSNKVYVTPRAALYMMRCFVMYVKAERLDGSSELEIAGKNFSKFDDRVMENFFEREVGHDVYKEKVMDEFSYRYVEIGSMYKAKYGKQVSLSQINKLFSRPDVEHKAYADGIDTVRALRLACLSELHKDVALEKLAKEVG